MQINLLIHESDFSTDDTVWHDFCTECAGDVVSGDAHCYGCVPF